MGRKGQSAIEYLVTYGWMVLAVAIVGGIAYDTVGTGCSRSFTGFYDDSISVGTFGVDTEGNFRIALENDEFREINVDRFNVSSSDTMRYKDLDVAVEPGTSQALKVPGYSQAQTCQELDVQMVFDKGPLEGQVVRGTISAPIAVDAVDVPDSPLSLDADA